MISTDEALILIALAPFYVMGITGSAFALAYLVRSFMDSATETQIKDTLTNPSK